MHKQGRVEYKQESVELAERGDERRRSLKDEDEILNSEKARTLRRSNAIPREQHGAALRAGVGEFRVGRDTNVVIC